MQMVTNALAEFVGGSEPPLDNPARGTGLALEIGHGLAEQPIATQPDDILRISAG